MKHAFKASRRHEIISKLEQPHLLGGGGDLSFAKIDLPRGENHETRGGLFFFHLPRGENPVRMLSVRKGGRGEGQNRLGGGEPRGIRYSQRNSPERKNGGHRFGFKISDTVSAFFGLFPGYWFGYSRSFGGGLFVFYLSRLLSLPTILG